MHSEAVATKPVRTEASVNVSEHTMSKRDHQCDSVNVLTESYANEVSVKHDRTRNARSEI